jgi:CRP/FNR family transcriptional regulator
MVAGREIADTVAGSFLGRLPSDLVDVLVEMGERTDYPAGNTIYRGGFVSKDAAGRRWLAACLHELSGGPADVGVQTLAESSLFRIDSRTLTAAAHRDARVSWALARELNRRLCETLQQTAINAFGALAPKSLTRLETRRRLVSTRPIRG